MVMRTVYTARYLDPQTMEPAERLVNPFNGIVMELEDYLSIETFLLYRLELQFHRHQQGL